MSDEAHMEAASRRGDPTVVRQWHSLPPDECMMAKEEGAHLGDQRAIMQELLFVYLFVDGMPAVWQNVALRALAVLRHFTPGLLRGRAFDEVAAIQAQADPRRGFVFADLVGLVEADSEQYLLRMLRYFFPDGKDWLKEGCMRVYLIARNYQPWLVTVGTEALSFEELSWVFGEIDFNPREVRVRMHKLRKVEGQDIPKTIEENEMDRARSRWSARAQNLIRKPIEKAGGRIHLQFGKSAETRGKYADAARGNQNRKKVETGPQGSAE